MDKITIVEKIDPMTQKVIEHIIIDHGNDQFTSMLKSTYDAQQVEHLTEIVPTNE